MCDSHPEQLGSPTEPPPGVVGVLLNLDKKSPNASLLRAGQLLYAWSTRKRAVRTAISGRCKELRTSISDDIRIREEVVTRKNEGPKLLRMCPVDLGMESGGVTSGVQKVPLGEEDLNIYGRCNNEALLEHVLKLDVFHVLYLGTANADVSLYSTRS